MKRIAVVTGASSGMGREFVMRLNTFCPDLNEIWVLARRRERLEQLAVQCPVPVRIFAGDLTKKKFRRVLENTLREEQPVVRILICLSGTCKNRVFPGQRQPSLFCEKAVCGRSAGSCQESIKRQSEKERPVCLRRRHKTGRTGSKAAAAQTDYADVLLNTEHAEAGSVSY